MTNLSSWVSICIEIWLADFNVLFFAYFENPIIQLDKMSLKNNCDIELTGI